MKEVLEYNTNFFGQEGVFIKPNGDFFTLAHCHDYTAKFYCLDSIFDRPKSIESRKNCSPYLTDEEFKLFCDYYNWKMKNNNDFGIYSSFLGQVLGYNAFFTSPVPTIITSDSNYPIHLYNYILMDFDVFYIPLLIKQPDGTFLSSENTIDTSVLEELEQIKAKTKSFGRRQYFKDTTNS